MCSGSTEEPSYAALPPQRGIILGAVLGGELAVPCTCKPLKQG
jgi:hypothetical protein